MYCTGHRGLIAQRQRQTKVFKWCSRGVPGIFRGCFQAITKISGKKRGSLVYLKNLPAYNIIRINHFECFQASLLTFQPPVSGHHRNQRASQGNFSWQKSFHRWDKAAVWSPSGSCSAGPGTWDQFYSKYQRDKFQWNIIRRTIQIKYTEREKRQIF